MLTIRYARRDGEDEVAPRSVTLTVHSSDGTPVGQVNVALDPVSSSVLPTELDEEGNGDLVFESLLRYGVRRLRAELEVPRSRNELLGDGPVTWSLHTDDLDELKRLHTTKRCDYQLREGRDLYCAAAVPTDDIVVGRRGLRAVAPTSRATCVRCGMPDATVLCSHLLHPEVYGDGGIEDPYGRRSLADAMCDLARPEIKGGGASGCHAGGHGCWERVVEDRQSEPAELPPLALVDAIESLDIAWRLRHRGERLLEHVRSPLSVAGIEQPVTDRESFRARVDDLADVLDSFTVNRDLVPDSRAEARGWKSLGRMEAILGDHLEDEDRARALLQPLRDVVRLRNAQTHADASGEAPQRAARLGFEWPPADWRDAWMRIRGAVVVALRDIRRALDEGTAGLS